mgnify:FL=1
MKDVPKMFGSMVFNDEEMQARLPEEVYLALKKSMAQGTHLELDVANAVANAMKDWAIEKGATHFTHWFQPMTGITAEKHDSFISFVSDTKVIMEFSGKELVRGEPDASSFPSGGLRSTFEARGYTVWDLTSYAFIRESTLYIPTAFCSYSGEALDTKTPLLRSMQALDKQARRILRLFGHTDVKRVVATAGPEQEYFLIDKEVFLERPDLIYTGRTLIGARPPKGQELEDHYFGSLKPRVLKFMQELEEELWQLGVPAKTKHNEVAPAQHELACIFRTVNLAADHNYLTMQLMKSIADKHGLACLFHEKPFVGVNGSGKHINWSMATDTGINLLEPGDTPQENAQFLLFLVAVIKAVHEYQDLLRASVATAGNDHRLGANEAPPAIVSMFLGNELTEILEAVSNGGHYEHKAVKQMEIGVTALPHIPKDITDRNRTSPFAFTGNKFEFRMPGASLPIAEPCTVLNTAVAEALRQFADILERAEDFQSELSRLIKETFQKHKNIIFNDNSYSEAWPLEAERRGLLNLKTYVDALPVLVAGKNVELFIQHQVLTPAEIHSRFEILLERYCKNLQIEAATMANMVRRQIIPGCIGYQNELMQLLMNKRAWCDYDSSLEEHCLRKISNLGALLVKKLEALDRAMLTAKGERDPLAQAQAYRDAVCGAMAELRLVVDELETLMSGKHWPFPTYGEILYSVN